MEGKLHFTEKEAQANDPEISVKRKKRITNNSWYDRDLGIRTTLQQCPVKALRIRLNGMLVSLKSSPLKLNKIHGMIHVLEDLVVKNETIFIISSLPFPVRGIMTFSTAYQLYSGAFTNKPDVDYLRLNCFHLILDYLLFYFGGLVSCLLFLKVTKLMFLTFHQSVFEHGRRTFPCSTMGELVCSGQLWTRAALRQFRSYKVG